MWVGLRIKKKAWCLGFRVSMSKKHLFFGQGPYKLWVFRGFIPKKINRRADKASAIMPVRRGVGPVEGYYGADAPNV